MQYDDLGKFIRKERNTKRISLNNFALNSGIEPATLSNFETGKSDILFETLVKISNGFNLKVSELLSKYEQEKNML